MYRKPLLKQAITVILSVSMAFGPCAVSVRPALAAVEEMPESGRETGAASDEADGTGGQEDRADYSSAGESAEKENSEEADGNAAEGGGASGETDETSEETDGGFKETPEKSNETSEEAGDSFLMQAIG